MYISVKNPARNRMKVSMAFAVSLGDVSLAASLLAAVRTASIRRAMDIFIAV